MSKIIKAGPNKDLKGQFTLKTFWKKYHTAKVKWVYSFVLHPSDFHREQNQLKQLFETIFFGVPQNQNCQMNQQY